MNKEVIKVLILEDNPADAEFNQYQLRKKGLKVESRVVENKANFLKSLKEYPADIILSDFSLPQFNGLEAIKLAGKLCPDVPVIVVSGVVGDELAVTLMKEGAVDFVLKERLTCLPGAVTRALAEAEHIREYKKAKQALIESEEKYRSVMESAQDGIIVINAKGKIDSWNKGAEQIFGYKANEIIGNSLTEIIPAENRKAYTKSIQKFFKSGKVNRTEGIKELIGQRKNGELFPLELSFSSWKSSNEVYVSGIIRDISQRKKMDEALQISEERYRGLFMHAADAIFLIDANNKIIDSNEYAQKLYGYTIMEFKYMEFSQLFENKSDAINLENSISKSKALKEIPEANHITRGSEKLVVSISSSKIVIAQNTYYQFICRDLTASKQTKEQIITLSKAFHQSPVSIIITDTEGKITYVNPKFEVLTGYSAIEVIGKNPRFLMSGHMPAATYKTLWERITKGKVWKGELLNKKKDGTLYWEQASISGMKNEEDVLIGFVAFQEDITWRKKIQQDLIYSEERYRNLITLAPDPIIEIDIDGYLISANPAYVNLVGLSTAGKAKIHITDQRYITVKSAKLLSDELQKTVKNETQEPFEIELITSQRDLTTVEINLKLISQQGKDPILLAICRDITERKKAKGMLLMAIMSAEDNERQKISSAIHDGLQQMLICTSLEFEQVKAENEGKLVKNKAFTQGLEFLNKAINESRNIAHTLLPKTVEDSGLVGALEEMVSRLELLSRVKIKLACEIDEVLIDTSISLRLYHIVQEAVNNALKHAHPSVISITLTMLENKLLLNIIDDGDGFDPNTIDSKLSFGIRTMEQKAKAISGEFTIDSAPGKGTNITIEIPLTMAN